MPTLTSDDVLHIARLARLHLAPEEAQRMTVELQSIFTFVDRLNEVSTDGIEPVAQVTGLSSVLRDDSVSQAIDPSKLLQSSSLPIIDHCIAAPHAHG